MMSQQPSQNPPFFSLLQLTFRRRVYALSCALNLKFMAHLLRNKVMGSLKLSASVAISGNVPLTHTEQPKAEALKSPFVSPPTPQCNKSVGFQPYRYNGTAPESKGWPKHCEKWAALRPGENESFNRSSAFICFYWIINFWLQIFMESSVFVWYPSLLPNFGTLSFSGRKPHTLFQIARKKLKKKNQCKINVSKKKKEPKTKHIWHHIFAFSPRLSAW